MFLTIFYSSANSRSLFQTIETVQACVEKHWDRIWFALTNSYFLNG